MTAILHSILALSIIGFTVGVLTLVLLAACSYVVDIDDHPAIHKMINFVIGRFLPATIVVMCSIFAIDVFINIFSAF